MYRLCVKLYKNRCAELVQERADLSCIHADCISRENASFHDIHVSVDFVQFLGVLVRKTGVIATTIETTMVQGHGYISWLMVTCPHNNIGMECIFSDPCPEAVTAEQRVVRKASFFIDSRLNLEIVDGNYGDAAKLGAKCSLIREKFMILKGHLECLERSSKQDEFSTGLGSEIYMTPTDEGSQISVLSLPPNCPIKRRVGVEECSKNAKEVEASDCLVTNVPDLEAVFKRARVD
ncbi:uncharacterized protein LOC110737359 [Chenopodium quinoa]|uniref:uncharacterized protein LOC110737359 n=1 Tax=Chenopodium quinoa TaxID=63459 RepID=UPI000B78C5EB|nr:uncharacterized protein LOC110737359 [Chenopodium quinoa]XP_021773403.1 uncharacterized protein LOC110737359 [Chenopodium quinoa]